MKTIRMQESYVKPTGKKQGSVVTLTTVQIQFKANSLIQRNSTQYKTTANQDYLTFLNLY